MHISKIAFLSALLTMNAVCMGNDRQDDEKLLNEIINDTLLVSGIDNPIKIGGMLNFTTLFVDQNEKGDNSNTVPALEGDINFVYLNKCRNFGYGTEVRVKVNSGMIKQGSPIVRIACLLLESEIGTMKFGYTSTAADLLTIDGGCVLVGYGGPASRNFSLFYNESAGSFVDTGFAFDDNKAAKIVYLSPTIAGFSAGLSFTFDSRCANPFKTLHPKPCNQEIGEERANFPGMRTAYSRNIITGGITYDIGDPDGLNAKFALSGWIGKGESGIDRGIKAHNVCAYNIGAIIQNKDLKLSFGYMDCGKSLRPKKYATDDIAVFDPTVFYNFGDPAVGFKQEADAGKVYSVGMAYSFCKLDISAGYFKSVVAFSKTEKSKADTISLAAEYKFNKTISIYAEHDHIKTNTCTRAQVLGKACGRSPTGKNNANIFMIGTKINI